MDDEEGGTCNVCGGLLRYGGRHRKCGETVMRAVAEDVDEFTAGLQGPNVGANAPVKARSAVTGRP